jgi:hypothetical protein
MRLLAYKSQNAALLVDYWMSHENREMGTRYAKQLVEEVAWRKQWAKKVGLGFKLSDLQLEKWSSASIPGRGPICSSIGKGKCMVLVQQWKHFLIVVLEAALFVDLRIRTQSNSVAYAKAKRNRHFGLPQTAIKMPSVLVQPEMERGRSPLVSEYSTLRAVIFKVSIRPPGYPSAWLLPRRARFRFAWQEHCSSHNAHPSQLVESRCGAVV